MPRILVFIDADAAESTAPGGPRILSKHFETTVLLTNTTPVPLNLEIRVRDGEGVTLATRALTLPPNGTRAVAVSDLLP